MFINKEISGIYKIQNLINNKIYIGQSINIEYRFYQHTHTQDNCYIHKAIQKYGEENFSFKIIEDNLYSKELRNKREIYWINFYNSLAPNGYNLTKGGDNIAEIIKRPVKQFSLKGEYIQTFESQTKASKELNIPSNNISNACNYIIPTAGGYLWRFLEDNNEVKPYSLGKTICQYTLKGEYIQTFDNATVASKILNIERSNITAVCKKNRMKSAGGYIWRYEDDTSYIEPVKPKGKKIQQYSIETKELIAEYNSISEAARALNVFPSNMTVAIKKPNKIYKNYYWEIIEE